MQHFENIDDYISSFPASTQKLLRQMRAATRKAAPGAEEAISYGMPTLRLNGNLVHFAAYKTHIGFYPGAGGIEAFKDEVSQYNNSKGTVQFPLDKPLPLALVTMITKFRVMQNEEKAAQKAAKKKPAKK